MMTANKSVRVLHLHPPLLTDPDPLLSRSTDTHGGGRGDGGDLVDNNEVDPWSINVSQVPQDLKIKLRNNLRNVEVVVNHKEGLVEKRIQGIMKIRKKHLRDRSDKLQKVIAVMQEEEVGRNREELDDKRTILSENKQYKKMKMKLEDLEEGMTSWEKVLHKWKTRSTGAQQKDQNVSALLESLGIGFIQDDDGTTGISLSNLDPLCPEAIAEMRIFGLNVCRGIFTEIISLDPPFSSDEDEVQCFLAEANMRKNLVYAVVKARKSWESMYKHQATQESMNISQLSQLSQDLFDDV